MKILIIEDQDSIRRMIEALVSARGHEVAAVNSGAKGLEKALAETPDVILLDLNLPGTYDGFEVTQKLREEESTRAVPIIIISALGDDDSKRRAHDAGASAYYTKPFSPIALLKELEALRVRSSGAGPAASPLSKPDPSS
jgi:DNA-binding response OmpR family regulator